MESRGESSVMLPSGQQVCRLHQLLVCTICRTDSILPEQAPVPIDGPHNASTEIIGYRPISKLILPEKFVPPSQEDTPETLFQAKQVSTTPPTFRTVREDNNEQHLIYIAGACPNNGAPSPKAGCAYVFAPVLKRIVRSYAYVSFRLENEGPTDEGHPQTKERADLRAVIGALRFRGWKGMEECTGLVIATDSSYIVEGITTRMIEWLENGWKTHTNNSIKNQDLWKYLLRELESCWFASGMRVQFWHIPGEQNWVARRMAKAVAYEPDELKFIHDIGPLTEF